MSAKSLGHETSAAVAATGPSYLADITIEHGPPGVLGRFFLAADSEARRRGITVTFGTYDELLAVNAKNRDSWKPLTSMYDVRSCPKGLAPERAFCLFGRDANGDVVATQCARLYPLSATTLYDEATSLRLFYDDPQKSAGPGEACIVTAEKTKTLTGRILVGGAVWYRPDFRGRGLAAILPRISRAYAYTRWNTDWTTSLFMEGPAKGGVIQSSGYTHGEWELRLVNAPNGNPRCCVVWMDGAELAADLQTYLDGLASEVDAGGLERRA